MSKRRHQDRRTPSEPAVVPPPAAAGATAGAAPAVRSPRLRTALVAAGILAIVVAAFLVYTPARRGEFVWDDLYYVVDNSMLKDPGGLVPIWVHPADYKMQFYPLTYTTLWLNYRIGGLDPFNYHLTNVGLHAGAALLIWLLLARLMPGVGAFAAALFFTVHPMHVESVAWVCERKNVLSGLFGVLTVLCWDSYLRQHRARWYGLALGCFLLGMLSKTILTMVIPLLAVWIWWRGDARNWRDYVRLAGFVLVAVAILPATYHAEQRHLQGTTYGLTLAHSLVIAGRALWFYVGHLLWPTGLMSIYPKWELEIRQAASYLPLAAFALACGLTWLARRRLGNGVVVGLCAYVFILAPALSFLDFGFLGLSYVADHFAYHPSVGILGLAGAGLAALAGRWCGRHAVTVAATVAVLVAVPLGWQTWRLSRIYATQESFWSHNYRLNPTATSAGALGDIYLRRAQYDLAIPLVEESLRLADNSRGHYRLGEIYYQLRRYDEALDAYRRAIKVNRARSKVPGLEVGALNNMAIIHWRERHLQEAITCWQRVLALQPGHAVAKEYLPRARERLKAQNPATVPRHAAPANRERPVAPAPE